MPFFEPGITTYIEDPASMSSFHVWLHHGYIAEPQPLVIEAQRLCLLAYDWMVRMSTATLRLITWLLLRRRLCRSTGMICSSMSRTAVSRLTW